MNDQSPWRRPVPIENRNVVHSGDLDGRVAVVTGGASGIGAGVARYLGAHGARVVVADVDVDNGEAVAQDVGGVFIRCDVRRPEDSVAAVARAEETWGGLDLVHLNAGVITGTSIDDFDPERYRRAMAVNLDGIVYGTVAAVPALRRRRGGTIIATASMAGIAPLFADPFYTANKHAVVGFCRSLGRQLWPQGIWVTALCPSFTDTPILPMDRELFESAGVGVLSVDDVVAGFVAALDSRHSGECYYVLPDEGTGPIAFDYEALVRARPDQEA